MLIIAEVEFVDKEQGQIELSVIETLLRFGTFGPLQFCDALGAAAEAQRLRGAYEQFVATRNQIQGIQMEYSGALDGASVDMPLVAVTRELMLSPAEVASRSGPR